MESTTLSSPVGILKRLKKKAQSQKWVIPVRKDPYKRLFDIAFSVCVLIGISPLLGAVALLVKISSKGPIFFQSERLGRGGKIIRCLKFRSMYQDAEERLRDLLAHDPVFQKEWETFQKVEKDPRITPIGKILRKTSMDELPQFWNVFIGDLSVVGPRPPTLLGPPEKYHEEIQALYGSWAAQILSVRPGITGIWQVSGRSKIPFDRRCEIEAEYAMTRTFWKDLIVILKTLPVVLSSKGAC